jgi:hypothetical protein
MYASSIPWSNKKRGKLLSTEGRSRVCYEPKRLYESPCVVKQSKTLCYIIGHSTKYTVYCVVIQGGAREKDLL